MPKNHLEICRLWVLNLCCLVLKKNLILLNKLSLPQNQFESNSTKLCRVEGEKLTAEVSVRDVQKRSLEQEDEIKNLKQQFEATQQKFSDIKGKHADKDKKLDEERKESQYKLFQFHHASSALQASCRPPQQFGPPYDNLAQHSQQFYHPSPLTRKLSFSEFWLYCMLNQVYPSSYAQPSAPQLPQTSAVEGTYSGMSNAPIHSQSICPMHPSQCK